MSLTCLYFVNDNEDLFLSLSLYFTFFQYSCILVICMSIELYRALELYKYINIGFALFFLSYVVMTNLQLFFLLFQVFSNATANVSFVRMITSMSRSTCH